MLQILYFIVREVALTLVSKCIVEALCSKH